ncbi:DHA2 family efflux MFS transporter permease subunit [Labrys monachus]|uniref:EmrB/QacA subfamily drug resistance transporter n=1 Tax=Labrys monachus TaxID=217067 RepID=A0ABU0FIW4_9HYPH|nr:DHA2 family efflux MFS transporter permease subunit [Labrys monachus]MDQ0394426.1 EmrB/QacA subfamily drug resistance transporter [Labrys monachus]
MPPLPSPASSKQLLPWLVAVAFFMESLDTTILNTAVPTISQALAVAPLSMKSVLASYTLSLAVFIPISGWMADRFGTRQVFASAIGLFTLGSLLCGIASNIHLLVACRILQGCGGAMMVPVGRLTLVRTFAKAELIRAMSFVAIPGLVGPMLGPLVGGLIVDYLHWRFIFFVNLPIGIAGLVLVYLHLPDYREPNVKPLDVVGLILFGSGVALLSYVLEIFGDHTLGLGEILGLLALSLALIGGYGLHAARMAFPLLQLALFRIRTFGTAVSGSFFTRLGIGGVPFLLPLLYQVGLGFSPVQSGLLIMPQALAAMSTKFLVPRVLRRFGYRAVLISNTIVLGLLLMLFAAVGPATPLWAIVLLAFSYGAFTSLQYTSMNTLVYADIDDEKTSNASSIASTVQQMSISFGVAAAGLTTAFFVPDSLRSNPAVMIEGIHDAFLTLGALTILSTIVFHRLKSGDGNKVSQQKDLHLG